MKIEPKDKKISKDKKDEIKRAKKLKQEGKNLDQTALIELVLEMQKKIEDLEKRLAKVEGKKEK